MGMTPAVALTTQSIQPIQAFAASDAGTFKVNSTVVGNGTTGKVPYNGQTYTIDVPSGYPAATVTTSDDQSVTTYATGSTYKIASNDSTTPLSASFEIVKATLTPTPDSQPISIAGASSLTPTEQASIKGAVDISSNGATPVADTDYEIEVGTVSNNEVPCTVKLTSDGQDNFELAGDNKTQAVVNVPVSVQATPEAPSEVTIEAANITAALNSSEASYIGAAVAAPSATVMFTTDDGKTFPVPSENITVEAANDASLVNADTYDMVVSFTYVNGNTTYTGQKTLDDAFTINPAQLVATAPASIAAGIDAAGVKSLIKVEGLQGTDTATNVYSMTVTNLSGTPEVTQAGKPVSVNFAAGSDATLADNYVLPANLTNIPVDNAVTINGEQYTVALADNGQINAATLDGTDFAWSYNGKAQTPKIVFANTNPASQNKVPTSGYTILYGEYDATLGDYVAGDPTIPTAVGKYQVTIEVGTGATTKTVELGTYEIAKADIQDRDQVEINWNGQPVNGANKNLNVTANGGDLLTPLTVVYPSSGITVAYPAEYKVTQGAGTLTIAPQDGVGYVTNLKGTPIVLNYSVANYQIGSAAMSAAFLGTNPTYTGAAITATSQLVNNQPLSNDAAIVVKNSQGVVVPQQSVYYSTTENAPAGTFTQPAQMTVDQYNAAVAAGTTTPTVSVNGTSYPCQLLTNWTPTYTNNVNAGTATVTITGNNNYAGQASTVFTIAPRNVSELTLALPTQNYSVEYDAEAQTPDVTVSGTGIVDSEGNATTNTVKFVENQSKLFTVSYANNTNASNATTKASATITAANPNFTGSKTIAFDITPYNLKVHNATTTAANLQFTTNAANYDADVLTVVSGLTIKGSAVPMTEDTDYKVQQNIVNGASQAWGNLGMGPDDKQKQVTYAIEGHGNYTGTITANYFVAKTSVTDYIEKAAAPIVYFNGKDQKPAISIKLKGVDKPIDSSVAADLKNAGLTVTYANNRNASNNATFTISASGSTGSGANEVAYYGSWPTQNFVIQPSDLTDAKFAILYPEETGNFSYTGSQIKPIVAISDKTVGEIANTDGVTTKGIITTKIGTVIDFKDIADEYTISYGANTAVTDQAAKTNFGTVTITPTSANMTKSATEQFVITAAQITDADIKGNKTKGVFKVQADGVSYAEPDITVVVNKRTLVRNVDYTLTVSKGQKVGQQASWVVAGIGNYTGQVSGTFMVVNDIANATITMPDTTYTYDGTKKEPQPTITFKNGNATTVLELGTDYSLTYENNVDAGTATVVITGEGDNWGGEVKKTFTIAQAEGKLDITGSVLNYTYTGAAATPEPDFTFTVGNNVMKKADLVAGTDYEYVYTNNTDSEAVSGKKATVSVKMLGNYGASNDAVVSFTIEQANVASAEVVVGDVTAGKTPKVAVTMGGRALVQGKDFTFAADTKTPGQKTATITGIGNYTGTQKVTFTVLNDNQVPADDANLTGGTWKKTNGQWQYITKDGKLVSSGWAKINGEDYYFDSKGNAATGWANINGKDYYFNTASDKGTECAMVANGWKQIGDGWYHFNKWGHMSTGWVKDKGVWYYCNKWGRMTTGWQQVAGFWYYMDKWGHMTTGWQQIGGSWYYLNGNGAMAANTWVGNYYVDASGRWVR